MKQCKTCLEAKPASEFHVNNQAKDGLRNYCQPCSREHSKKKMRELSARRRGVPFPDCPDNERFDPDDYENVFEDPNAHPVTDKEARQLQKERRAAKNALTAGEFIYVITHPLLKGYVKIGHTDQPEKRLSSYNTGDPLKRYTYAHVEEVFDRKLGERLVHRKLDSFRVARTEWFKMHVQDAIGFLKRLHSSTYVTSGH